MVVDPRHAELFHGVAFEIELDQHGGFIAHHPALVSGLDARRTCGALNSSMQPSANLMLIWP